MYVCTMYVLCIFYVFLKSVTRLKVFFYVADDSMYVYVCMYVCMHPRVACCLLITIHLILTCM